MGYTTWPEAIPVNIALEWVDMASPIYVNNRSPFGAPFGGAFEPVGEPRAALAGRAARDGPTSDGDVDARGGPIPGDLQHAPAGVESRTRNVSRANLALLLEYFTRTPANSQDRTADDNGDGNVDRFPASASGPQVQDND